jgi:hypothetical protein
MQTSLLNFENFFEQKDIFVPAVSKWPVGMHIHHACLVTKNISQALLQSDKSPPAGEYSLKKVLVFTFGYLPRGKGQSPQAALPRDKIALEELRQILREAEELHLKANKANAKSWFKHQYFGVLKKSQALRFIDIHNNHHTKIIEDILSESSQR